eukprot:GHRR01003772.1.p3 GENE.GHRR01003772.1~~GHRR01003772.1.p3  ORF type:complete len:108 (+),score=45.95 GHRR01003772.1:1219-1542(+)
MEVKAAHNGERVQALVLGPSGVSSASSASASGAPCPSAVPATSTSSIVTVLYSGGDDKLVRRWDARLLVSLGEPLQVHQAGVKALAVGQNELLVSGDAAGEVAVWTV